ncbi:FecR family protein [Pseudoroseomonas sp. WGS1072]|uniref:FecR family protein n=1 Tax=Roseomonas sp. WGS1072 TaxID=3366816 RepID=UPI003BF312CA
MTDAPPDRDALRREAGAWLARLTSGQATDADAWQVASWRARSPAHEAAFQEAARLWRQLAPVMAEAPAAALPRLAAGRRGLLMGTGLAASLAGLLVAGRSGGWLPDLTGPGADHRTGTGERRTLTLADGSIVEMNTLTSLSVRFTEAERRILLMGGEAAFTVPRDPSRPFIVASAGGETRVLGTVFTVAMAAGAVSVTDLEGRVAVRSSGEVQLRPGEQVTYDKAGLGPVLRVDPVVASGWRQGLLVFRDRTVREVVAELNRYRAGHILLLNDEAGQRRVSGVFHLDRPDQVVAHLQRMTGLRDRALPGGLLLLR